MRVLYANQLYAQLRLKRNTALIVKEISINPHGFEVLLHTTVDHQRESFNLFVKADSPVEITKDQAAIIVGALVLQSYKTITYQFDVGTHALGEIRMMTNALVTASEERPDIARPHLDGWSMNFSGGVDSTALHAICPKLKLKSINFSSESPENERFKESSAATVTTNAADFMFPHWPSGYYNLASLLYANTDKLSLCADGKIMSDSMRIFDFLDGFVPSLTDNPEGEHIYGMKLIHPMAGTQSVVFKHKKQHYGNAGRASTWIAPQKSKSKLFIDEIFNKKAGGLDLQLSKQVAKSVPTSFSAMYNFYAIYFVKHLGRRKAAEYVNDLPKPLLDLAEMELGFYTKYDPGALRNCPQDFADYFLRQLDQLGVELYSSRDYEERGKVLTMVSAANRHEAIL
jgi:hypothetical protein